MWMNCPLCDSKLITNYEHFCQYGTEEYQYYCPKNCYYETFAHGGTEINICDFTIIYSYKASTETLYKIRKQIEAICEIEKDEKQQTL